MPASLAMPRSLQVERCELPRAAPFAWPNWVVHSLELQNQTQRICASLRTAGIEVWFEQRELRGGDASDAPIRKQIKSCALFIPIISNNTHAREEGYCRLRVEARRGSLAPHDHKQGVPAAGQHR
jgi:hypothetical protein